MVLNRCAGESTIKNSLHNGCKGSFIILDIDDFKHINDTYGHQVGDEAICAVSQQLKSVFRDSDVVWRLGGYEFAVFAVDLLNKEICQDQMRKIQNGLKNIHISDSNTLEINISIGCSICRTSYFEFDYIYKVSDEALYEAKRKGKNGYTIHEL